MVKYLVLLAALTAMVCAALSVFFLVPKPPYTVGYVFAVLGLLTASVFFWYIRDEFE